MLPRCMHRQIEPSQKQLIQLHGDCRSHSIRCLCASQRGVHAWRLCATPTISSPTALLQRRQYHLQQPCFKLTQEPPEQYDTMEGTPRDLILPTAGGHTPEAMHGCS
jgi:hypothetical protein